MKPLLLGLDNPISNDPADALVPWPANCSGHRLLKLMQAEDPTYTDLRYMAEFERLNLAPHPVPLDPKVRRALWHTLALALINHQAYRVVIGLGSVVRDAMDLREEKPFRFFTYAPDHFVGSLRIAWMPHPSGRNRYYNGPEIRRRAGEFLLGLRGL